MLWLNLPVFPCCCQVYRQTMFLTLELWLHLSPHGLPLASISSPGVLPFWSFFFVNSSMISMGWWHGITWDTRHPSKYVPSFFTQVVLFSSLIVYFFSLSLSVVVHYKYWRIHCRWHLWCDWLLCFLVCRLSLLLQPLKFDQVNQVERASVQFYLLASSVSSADESVQATAHQVFHSRVASNGLFRRGVESFFDKISPNARSIV